MPHSSNYSVCGPNVFWPAFKWNLFSSTLTRCYLVISDWNLRNSMGEQGDERRGQSLCDKRDNNFVWKNISPNLTFLQTDLFVIDKKT